MSPTKGVFESNSSKVSTRFGLLGVSLPSSPPDVSASSLEAKTCSGRPEAGGGHVDEIAGYQVIGRQIDQSTFRCVN